MPQAAVDLSGNPRVNKKAIVKAAAWTAAAKWGTQILSWASFIVVVRLLSPRDVGLIGMTAVFSGLVTMLAESGTGSTIVVKRNMMGSQIRQLNTISVVFSVFLAVLSITLAGTVAGFYRSPEVAGIVGVAAIGFIATGFRSVPSALLERDLQFKTLAGIDAAHAVTQSLTAVTIAWFGGGYWSLAIGPVAGNTVGALLCLYFVRYGFAAVRFSSISTILGFSGTLMTTRLCWYAYTNSDFLVAGRMLGAAVLGAYSLAWNFAMLPLEKITALVVRISGSFFSALQHDRAELRRHFLGMTGVLSTVVFPAAVGLGLVAPELVNIAFGDKWSAAVRPLQLLSLSAAFRSLVVLIAPVLNVTGGERVAMWTSMLWLATLPLCFWIAAPYGLIYIGMVWVIIHPILSTPIFLRLFQSLDLKPGIYFRKILPATAGCLAMSAGVIALRYTTPSEMTDGVRLALLSITGAAIYCGYLFAFHRSLIESLLALRSGFRG
jgi:O-antigen/teichoic acid export membrane protein